MPTSIKPLFTDFIFTDYTTRIIKNNDLSIDKINVWNQFIINNPIYIITVLQNYISRYGDKSIVFIESEYIFDVPSYKFIIEIEKKQSIVTITNFTIINSSEELDYINEDIEQLLYEIVN